METGRLNVASDNGQRPFSFSRSDRGDDDILAKANDQPPKIKFNKHTLFYLKFLRKSFILFYIILNLFYHGLESEFYRKNYNWNAMRNMEIVLIFFILFDLVFIEKVLLKFKGKFITTLMISVFILFIVQLALKLWGPSDFSRRGSVATNIIRIFLTLFLIFSLDEKELLKYIRDKNPKKEKKKDLKSEGTFDKNQNPEYAGIINPKTLNNLKNHSHSKRGSILRVDRGSMEMNELKIIEELINVIKTKMQEKEQEKSEIKLSLNIKPFTRVLSADLDQLLNENFDIFNFDMDCLNNSIFLLMNYYYYIYKWEDLKIPETKFMNLIYNIQKGYNDNPYHNSTHSADVTNTCYYMLEVLDVKNISAYSSLDILILLLSSASHDIDHPGNNNMFEINTRSLLSLTYNDKSILENYHLFLFFNFLTNENMDIFAQFEMPEVKGIRKLFITNIIATDMANHSSDMKRFKDMVNAADFNPQKVENKEFIMTQIMHFSDISNGTKNFKLYKKWVDVLFEEFFAQGDKEKELGLPVSVLCDREKTKIPDSQVFFINAFTMDLASTLAIPYPKFSLLIAVLEENKKIWEEKKNQPCV